MKSAPGRWSWAALYTSHQKRRTFSMLTEKQYKYLMYLWEDDEETRCHRCHKRETCPASEAGVIHPCPYFKEEADHGTEE